MLALVALAVTFLWIIRYCTWSYLECKSTLKVLLYYWTKFYVISSMCKCVKICRYHRQHLQSNDLRFMKFAPTLSICVCMIAFQSESGIGQNTSWCIKQYLNPPKKQTVFFFRLLWLLSVAFWKIISALKSHMTCYNLNLHSFFTNLRKL